MQANLLVNIGEMFQNLWESSGLFQSDWQNYVMIAVSFVLMYLAIVKKFEPLLLLPIAFGMFLINIPGGEGGTLDQQRRDGQRKLGTAAVSVHRCG